MEVVDQVIETDDEGSSLVPSKDEQSRYLLQYLLSSRGICHENALLLALIKLNNMRDDFEVDIEHYLNLLHTIIGSINIKLSTLNYKIIRINHGVGKKVVSRIINNTLNELLISNKESIINLPETNRFYIYVNIASSDEIKLATSFSTKEIDFVKWSIEQFIERSMNIIEYQNSSSSNSVVKEINDILSNLPAEENSANVNNWSSYVTFLVGSTELLQYNDLSATEIENVLYRLCENKWFYKNDDGKFSIELRGIVELQEYLTSTYDLATCQNCHQLVFQGVLCNGSGSNDKCTQWHIDCFQHHVIHVDKNCSTCGNNLITNGSYII